MTFPNFSKQSYFIFVLLVTLLLVAVLNFSNVQPKTYINNVSQHLVEVNKSLRYYEGGLGVLDKNLKASEEAFYEMSTSKSYADAVPDTKQDIKDIEETLSLIAKARNQKGYFKVPEELETLDSLVESYYDKIVEALELLLVAEEFHQQLLVVSGDELDRELTNIDKLSNGPTDNIKYSAQLSKVIPLAEAAVARFDEINDIPPDQYNYWKAQRDWHMLLVEDLPKMVAALGPGTTSVEPLMREIANFTAKSKVITDARQADTKVWMANTPIKSLLIEALNLEAQINDELKVQAEQWEMTLPEMDEVIPASTSATKKPVKVDNGKNSK